MATLEKKTMKAVILKEPFKVVVEEVPVPTIEREDEAIIEVYQSGLCDLHWYRGHQPQPYNFILGHETLGRVAQVGKEVKKFKPGDMVVVPFSTSCGDCFYCNKAYTSRCVKAMNFGNPVLPGGQAEYFKLHLADTTLFHVPDDLPLELMVLMTDILPTGYSTAMNARRLADEGRPGEAMKREGVCLVIGCGPVGLCAITSATTMFEKVFATDLAVHRLEAAERHGAVALPSDQVKQAVLDATDGRGADAVLEVVGHVSALKSAMDIARPYGVISSCGVHTHETTLDGVALYGKNLRFQFGRCSVRTFFPAALEVLRNNQELFKTFVENKISWDQAEEASYILQREDSEEMMADEQFYKLFEQNKVAKTVFVVKK